MDSMEFRLTETRIPLRKARRGGAAVGLRGQLPLILCVLSAAASHGTLAYGQSRASLVSEQVEFINGEVTLAGTLTLPADDGLHPAVILISGSGPQDRDGAMPPIPAYTPFAAIADRLAQQGIAVLRYDDRGVGESSGEYIQADEEDFVEDAEAALEYLTSRKDIDSSRIGLIGHSEGGMIAAIVAGKRPGVGFVVSLAGPAVKGHELLLPKRYDRLRPGA